MNILFVLYGDLTSNSAHPLALYARELAGRGHHCAVAIPNNLETIEAHACPAFRAILFSDALAYPASVFPDGRCADVIHAWTPRENVRRFVTAYMAQRPTPLVVYLEDHELWISCRALGLDEDSLLQQTEQAMVDRLPDALSNPFRYRSFIGLADVAVVIQSKLKVDVPAWVVCEAVMPGVDLDFFSPRPASSALREKYGIAQNERIVVYPGGVNGFTRPGIKALCLAIGLINEQGYPCRLIRTGPFPLDFLDELPRDTAHAILDLGVIARADLPDLFALADVFVQPGAIDPYEDLRLPGKLPEILAMGRPVVMPDVNIAHLFEDGVNAILTRSGTAKEIAEKCIELFADPVWAQKIGDAGRRFAEKHFDIGVQALRMEAAYEQARVNFDASLGQHVWQDSAEGDSVDLLLARKLAFLAESKPSVAAIPVSMLLGEYGRLVKAMRGRADGLERATAVRDEHIASLSRAEADRAAQIASMQQVLSDQDREAAHLKQLMIEANHQVQGLRAEVSLLRQSASWRVTQPLRWIVDQVRPGRKRS